MTISGQTVALADVANKGLQLSLILNALNSSSNTQEITPIQTQLNSIARGVTLHSDKLKSIAQEVQSRDAIRSDSALHAAEALAEESFALLTEIERSIERIQQPHINGAVSSSQLFGWYFKDAKVTYLLAALESLNLSMSLLLQIIRIGKIMAFTSKHDSVEEVALTKDKIKQERLWARNLIITRHFQLRQVDHLYNMAEREEARERPPEIEMLERKSQGLLTSGIPQLAIEAPTDDIQNGKAEYQGSNLVKLPVNLLGPLETKLEPISESPRHMVQASEEVIEPLLDMWTRWHEVREERHQQQQERDLAGSAKFTPSVQVLPEDDDEPQYYEEHEREESPRGYFLEGNTTDWRQPHSVQARNEYARQRKRWSGYQASVSAESSDVDDSPGSKNSKKKRGPRRHVIDSASEDSASDKERGVSTRKRRTSEGHSPTERRSTAEMPPLAQSYTAGQAPPNRTTYPPPPQMYQSPRSSLSNTSPQMPRPGFHHAQTAPIPPLQTGGPNLYVPNSPYGPPPPQLYPQPMPSQAYRTYVPQAARLPVQPPRPVSRDGKPRSPSRQSSGQPLHPPTSYEARKAAKSKTRKNLGEGAAKGILGAGAIAGFLEALEGLSL